MTDDIIRRYLRYVGEHQLAVAGIATACAAIILLLNPHDVTAWIIAIACAGWLGLTAIQRRRDGR
jgi:hypothetical protein